MERRERREWVVIEHEQNQLFGVIHHPVGVKKGPALLTCHGFGGTKVGRFRLYVNLAQKLAEKGITVLRLDFRGSGDSEGELGDISVQGQIRDAVAGLQYLQGLESVDIDRIGIMGSSMGGAVAVNAGSEFGNVRSFALWAPLFCPQKWLSQWATQQSAFSFTEPTVEGWPVSKEFIAGFMALRVEDALSELSQVPMLHIHGEKDELVYIDHAEEYERARRNASVQSEFVRLPEADHIFTRPSDRTDVIDRTVDWFLKTL